MQTKRFPVRDLLTITTGRLLTQRQGVHGNGITALYAVLEWMTGEAPFTHQLPRFGDECKPWLLRWFPELIRVDAYLVDLDVLCREKDAGVAVEEWLTALNVVWACGLQDAYDVPRIPPDAHERKDTIDELVQMRGTSEGIIVVQQEPE